MHFVAWGGDSWSAPFRPSELKEDMACGGLMDCNGTSITWDADGYRGENWIALDQWTEKRASEISNREISGKESP